MDVYGELERPNASGEILVTSPTAALQSVVGDVEATIAEMRLTPVDSAFRQVPFLTLQLTALTTAKPTEEGDKTQLWTAATVSGPATFVLERSDLDGQWRVAEQHIPLPTAMCS